MTKRLYLRTLLLALLLGSASCSVGPATWRRQDIKKEINSIYSTRIFFNPPCPFAEAGLSFIWDPCGERAYLFVLSGCLEAGVQKNHVPFAYAIDNQVYQATAFLMKGGQVAELDNKTTKQLFHAFYHKKTVVIQIGPYTSIIPSGSFSQLYDDKIGIKNCIPRIIHNFVDIP